MKRLLLVVAALLLPASLVCADITVTMKIAVSGPMPIDGTTVARFKGSKARSDTKMMGQELSIITDAVARQQWSVNHVTKVIEAFDVKQAMAQLPIDFGAAAVSVTPTGRTREVLGFVCQGYTVEMAMPATIGGETLTMKIVGTMWAAKEGPGVAEWRAAQKSIADAGFSFSPIVSGPQAKAMGELEKALVDAGVLLESEQTISIEGTGQVGQAMAQVGAMTTSVKVSAISMDPVADSMFVLPEGYTRK